MAVQALVLMPAATTMALAAALAIGMVVVGALLIGDVLDRMARRRRQQDRLR
jgi:ABC-type dipeptide/oligopeptide/nickel transport system permease subunit